MKLLVVSHACSTSVNQRIYAEIQRQTGWELTLVVPRDWRDEFGNRLDEPAWPALRAQVWKIPVWMNGSIVFHTYRFCWKRFLEDQRFDVIYMNHEPYAMATAQVCFANQRAARPAAMGFYSCQNIQKRYPLPFRWMEQRVYRSCRFAFPITQAVAGVLRAKGFSGDITTSPLPIDPDLYHPYSASDRPGDMPSSEGCVTLGYVGRLVEEKGLRTLALALGRLSHLHWRLVIIGTGSFQPEFDRMLHAEGISARVTYLGYVAHHETPRYLAAMDVLVLPSETQANWKEQFGRVIPEALACGAAVVGSSSGEIPHLVSTSGGGLVFPERDDSALAKALEQLISSPAQRKEMAGRGGPWARTELSISKVATGMIAAFERAVNPRQKEHAATNA